MGASHSRNAREPERPSQAPRANGRRTRDDDGPEGRGSVSPQPEDGPASRRRRLSFSSTLRLRRAGQSRQPDVPQDVPEEPSGVDPLAAERQEAAQLIERVLGHTPHAAPHSPPLLSQSVHQPLSPEQLRGTFRPVPHFRPIHPAPRPSTLGTLLSEVLGATRPSPAGRQEPQSGTSVIVQGALVARTAQHRGESTGPQPDGTPQAATLQEQGEMLGAILRVATAATAASLVSMPAGMHPMAAHMAGGAMPGAVPAAFMPTMASVPRAASAPPQNTAGETQEAHPAAGAGGASADPSAQPPSAELLNRLNNLSDRIRTANEPREQESMTMISRLMREALRNVIPGVTGAERVQEAPPTPQAPAGSTAQSVLDALDNARQGRPLASGAPESFERFLHDLIIDLDVAVQRMRQTNTAVDDEEHVRQRRDGDISMGELSFFRLFRFERTTENLVPCVLVGVRSLRAGERLMGGEDERRGGTGPMPAFAAAAAATAATAATGPGAPSPQPTSRFILFVSGGRYRDEHPLLTAHPRDSGRDLMFMMELLGTMAAMSTKAPTASAADIARSGLHKVPASQIPSLIDAGKVTENAREKCLVCLEEWQAEDELR
ncbi:hypothetical protein MCUN1_003525 [Malassezia cuniculi]|uniref:Uncharacterized protein n=1 Tax=Malassezia cuniculi TaxID=948313 RepID=A0AAF0F1P7_9BASI|nr:hypothetical protein MCUN1_003525 [Malassezia cuniculi]